MFDAAELDAWPVVRPHLRDWVEAQEQPDSANPRVLWQPPLSGCTFNDKRFKALTTSWSVDSRVTGRLSE